MRNFITKKQQGRRMATFLFCTCCVLMSLKAQEEAIRKANGNEVFVTLKAAQGASDEVGIPQGGEQYVLLKTQDSITSVQSVSKISGERLLHRPTFQMENFLDGILPGLTTDFVNGYPTSQSALGLRGRNLLIVVDGIPRSDANIPPSQIESISVIKDGVGLAAMGLISGDGVLYIKTKRGKKQAMQIELTAQLAYQQQMNRAKFLNAYEYSKLLNEALGNDGLPAMYSDRDIELFRTGASPYTHPDVDWYDVLNRETAPIQQYNLNIYGGGQVARYYVDLNMYEEDGFLKQDNSANPYRTREHFEKYSLRANTDIDITKTTLLSVGLFGQMFRETTPGNGIIGSIYPALHYTPNNAYPVLNPNGTFGGAAAYPNNMYAQSIYSGYYLYPKTDFNLDVTLEHKFQDALEGLYVSGTYSYNSSYREQLNRSKKYAVSYYWKDPDDTTPDSPSNYTRLADVGPQSNSSSYSRQNRMQYMQLSAGYDFSVQNNNMKTKLSYLYNDYNMQGENLPMVKNGGNLSFEYDYAKKYLAEISISGTSLNQLKSGERWGWFPSAGIGWNMAQEGWMKDAAPGLDGLKLRTSYGINGSDLSGAYYRRAHGTLSHYYYTYMKHYDKVSNGISLGASPSGNDIYVEATLPYSTTWETIKRFTFGVDVEAFNRTLSGTVEFFHNTHSDVVEYGLANYNELLGVNAPYENKGKIRRSGLEFDIDYNNKLGQVTVAANANATMYWSEVISDAGLFYPEKYMNRTGHSISQIFGYVSDGIFQSQQEIDEYLATIKIPDYTPQPGDIRYVDINNDNVIDGKDIKPIATDAPRIEYGVYLGVEWRGLSLNSQWVGVANRDVVFMDLPFGINSRNAYGQALEEHLDRWTPNNPDARYPRVSAVANSYNQRTSTFWLKSGDYLRLKNLELAYSIPKQWASALQLNNVKLFTNAYNLLTLTGLKDRDPELYTLLGSGTIPNVRAVNFGLNIQF